MARRTGGSYCGWGTWRACMNRARAALAILAMLTLSHRAAADALRTEDQVKTTVAALRGHWSFHGSVSDSASKASSALTVVMDCRPAALGAAVSCALSGQVAGAGQIAAAMVIGFNVSDQRVYWMEISSTGEYHTHRGSWHGNTIEFEPLLTPSEHGTSTELFQLSFPSPGNLLLKSTTTSAEGSSTIEATAQRRPKP